jgi:hypothetical protein
MAEHTTHYNGCDCYEERITAPLNEQIKALDEALREWYEDYSALEYAWENTDTHPRHAPTECPTCDSVYTIIARRTLMEME